MFTAKRLTVVGVDPQRVELAAPGGGTGGAVAVPWSPSARARSDVGSGPELDPGARTVTHRGGERGVVAAHVPLGRARRRPLPRAALLDHAGLLSRAATLDAATTPRWQASAASRAPRAGLGVGRDLPDLAEQVDALLDVPDEVAAGHLVVVEHVGERLARRPVVRVRREPGIGCAGLGEPGVVLVGAQVLARAARWPAPAWRPSSIGQRAGGIGCWPSGPRRS